MTKEYNKKNVGPVIIKTLLLLFGLMGQTNGHFSSNFMSGTQFMYFTNQSNITIMAVAAVFLVYDVAMLFKKGEATNLPRFLLALRFIFTVAITLTFVVFSLMLTPQMIISKNTSYLFTYNNLCVHNIVPILAIVDWCLYSYDYKTTKNTFWLGAIMPLYYVIFTMVLSTMGNFFSGQNVPYFFFDYRKNGWFTLGKNGFGTAWWIIILCIAVLIMSKIFISIKDKRQKSKAAKCRQ